MVLQKVIDDKEEVCIPKIFNASLGGLFGKHRGWSTGGLRENCGIEAHLLRDAHLSSSPYCSYDLNMRKIMSLKKCHLPSHLYGRFLRQGPPLGSAKRGSSILNCACRTKVLSRALA
jgi:hypothetical protein